MPPRDKTTTPAPLNAQQSPWTALTWSDLDGWAGSRSVSRGQAYQGQRRVRKLVMAEDGRLLATVQGGEPYTVMAWPPTGVGGEGLRSACTCPVGYSCKHAVAAVAELLQMLASGQAIPPAKDGDPRLAELDDEGLTEDEDEATPPADIEEEDSGAGALPRRSRLSKHDREDRKIEEHIRQMSPGDLADLVVSLTQRFAELHEEFRERISLSQGDVSKLVAQARRELKSATRQQAWSDHWSGRGNTPDYGPLQRRLERLAEMGHHDQVVSLGRDLLERGMNQVAEASDEGETATALGECMAVVFRALAKSSLSGAQKLLWAIDAELNDGYDVLGDSASAILDADWPASEWSAAADELARRLRAVPPSRGADDPYSRTYARDNLSSWLSQALKHAGRGDERLAILEAEARATGSYERLVRELMGEQRYDDAVRWAAEGIEKTQAELPGIANSLTEQLCEVARQRKQWDVVAAHAAARFFEHPSADGFEKLIAAAKAAGCEQPVREAALQFLEEGALPITCARSAKGGAKVKVAGGWPLPVPDYLIPLLQRPGALRPGPHFDVLLDMAIAGKQPDRVLLWYDRMRAQPKSSADPWGHRSAAVYAPRVAAAVAQSHPDRALEIYEEQLQRDLGPANLNAYESAAATLRKMRPILEALDRQDDWPRLVAAIRAQYSNRPRFIEILDRLEGRPILQVQARRGRRR